MQDLFPDEVPFWSIYSNLLYKTDIYAALQVD